MKVAVVTPIPTPYRDPFWSHVAAQPGMDLSVYYCSGGKADRPWEANWRRDFAWEALPGKNLLAWRGADASCYWNPDITRRLARGRFDAVVVGGYNHPTMVAAMRFARRRGVPYFMMCESYRRSGGSRLKAGLKEAFVGRVMRRAAGTFPTGALAADYVRSYGANPDRVVKIPNVPDVEALGAQSARLREEAARTGDEDGERRPIVLFVGRLIPKKRAGLLLRAFHSARAQESARLVIVGDGPERTELERLAGELELTPHVHFAGFTQPAEVVTWFARASVFVLPSSETWGVAAIEALSCRTPVIVTNEVGCHPDAVSDRSVGRIVQAGSEEQLAESLRGLLTEPASTAEFEAAWAPTRCAFGYPLLAERFSQAIANCLSN